MVVYDITDGDSFANVKGWLKEIHENCYSVALILVGNKCDVDDKQRIVEKKDASRAQSFTSLMADLHEECVDIISVSSFMRYLKGTVHWYINPNEKSKQLQIFSSELNLLRP